MTERNSIYNESQEKTLAFYKKRHPLVGGNNPALLVVDVQRYFFDCNSKAFIQDSSIILPKIQALIEFFRKNNLPVLFTRHVDIPKSPMHNWWGNLMEENDSLTELVINCEHVIKKSSYDAFYETKLEEKLRDFKVDQLYICGVQTHLCISSSVRSAFIRGFNPVVITDAVASKYRQLHIAALSTLAHGFAILANSEEVKKCLSMSS
ncbi:MAG: cysteine hydrolase [Thermotogae bacterium]|nr:MAG: cysteine hydrolase [Thermotogota bacterium]